MLKVFMQNLRVQLLEMLKGNDIVTITWLTNKLEEGVVTAETFLPVKNKEGTLEMHEYPLYCAAVELASAIEKIQSGRDYLTLAVEQKDGMVSITEITTRELIINVDVKYLDKGEELEVPELKEYPKPLTPQLLRDYPITNRNLGLVEYLSRSFKEDKKSDTIKYVIAGAFFYANWEGSTDVDAKSAILANDLYNIADEHKYDEYTLAFVKFIDNFIIAVTHDGLRVAQTQAV